MHTDPWELWKPLEFRLDSDGYYEGERDSGGTMDIKADACRSMIHFDWFVRGSDHPRGVDQGNVVPGRGLHEGPMYCRHRPAAILMLFAGMRARHRMAALHSLLRIRLGPTVEAIGSEADGQQRQQHVSTQAHVDKVVGYRLLVKLSEGTSERAVNLISGYASTN